MKTVWEYTLENDIKRLFHSAHQIIVGFYKANNFIVLPTNKNLKSANIVTFPDLPYTKIPRFWETAKRIEVLDLPVEVDQYYIDRLAKFLRIEDVKPNHEAVMSLWDKASKEIVQEIYKVLPNVAKIKKLTIYPTKHGTSCSFNRINENGEIVIYLRDDQGIHAIAEAIITSLTRKDIYEKLEGLWQESEIISDFLVTETSIAKVLQKYESNDKYIPTLKGVRIKQHAKLLEESENFYKKLGIPTFEKPFGYNGLIPELFGKPIENLSETEKKVLLNLIRKSNTVTEIDEIGEVMFESEDNFSLYAIAKTIQRLRDKLEANGISGSYIQTLRGKGYVLKN